MRIQPSLSLADGSDFQSGTAMVTIPAGETRQCQDFPIIDDSVVETPSEESFVVRITDVDPDMVDVGENSSTTVTIVDDDSECLDSGILSWPIL